MKRIMGVVVVLSQLAGVPAWAQAPAVSAEADRIVVDVQKGTRLQRTMAAIALRHFAARQGSFRLFGHTKLSWWQERIAPAAPRLVQMLGDDSGLEWVEQDGTPGATTTPHKEAALALKSLGRAAVEPLLGHLEDPKIGPRAAEVLLRIAPEGPTGADPAVWRSWWAQHQQQTLPTEHGQLGRLIVKVLVLGLGVTVVVLVQRFFSRRAEAARRKSRVSL